MEQDVGAEGFVTKSPQELAAQVLSVGAIFLATSHPEGKQLDELYREKREYVERLLKSGISDQQLAEQLGRLYEEGRNLGIYSPLAGEKSEEFLQHAKEVYASWGLNEEEVEKMAREMLSKEGFLGELRRWRKNHEREIRQLFENFISQNPLSPEEENARIEQLQARVIYLNSSEAQNTLAPFFPDGNFLYHGTNVEQAIQILDSGRIVNAKTLIELEEERAKQEGREKGIVKRNSGWEGISWNFNQIGALPGDRYHLVGFLASPQEILTQETQLAIPSRPAPYELIMINSGIDVSRFYSLKTQLELLIHIGLGETNSVVANIIQLSLVKEGKINGESLLQNFIREHQDDEEITKLLRRYFLIKDDNIVELSPDLLQQTKNEIPVGAVWLQALLDTGRIQNVPGFEGVKNVREAIERIDEKTYGALLKEFQKERGYVEGLIKEEEEKVTSLSVPVSEVFLVVPDTDLRRYLRILSRCNTWPKGILVFSRRDIRLENFASMHRGDNQKMTEILKRAIPPRPGYIDYENDLLGIKITPDIMAGYRKHVIKEGCLGNRRSLKKNSQGKLEIS